MLYEVPHWLRQATFHLAGEGGTPVLVVEIASPSTRDNDLGIKRAFYYQSGVQKYIIVDRGREGEVRYGCLATSALPRTGSHSLQMPRDA